MPLTDDFMLPRRVRTMEQMADLLQAEETELGQAQRTIDAMAAQLSVGTSTFLLQRHERIFGLTTNTAESLEVRRARVLAKLNTWGVTTVQTIQGLARIITGQEGEVTEHFSDYAFSLTARLLFSDSTDLLLELIRQVDEIKPAHLIFDIICSMEPIALENRQALCLTAILFQMYIQAGDSTGLGCLQLEMGVAATEPHGSAVHMTSSNPDWRFNGQYRFNGKKKFNGGIVRSVL